MLTERDAAFLLDDLCITFGLCLGPTDRDALLASPPASALAFIDAVVRCEGLDPDRLERELLRQVGDRVAAAFGKHREHDD